MLPIQVCSNGLLEAQFADIIVRALEVKTSGLGLCESKRNGSCMCIYIYQQANIYT